MTASYVQLTDQLMGILKPDKDALEKYRDIFLARAELCSRDLVQCNDVNAMMALRGQISICYEQADAASAALNPDKGKANPEDEEGLPWKA